MSKIILDCSVPERKCDCCIFHRDDGCYAPMGLEDCYKRNGVWVVEHEDGGGQK